MWCAPRWALGGVGGDAKVKNTFSFKCLTRKCDGSDGRAAVSYPEDPGSNPTVSGSYENVFF